MTDSPAERALAGLRLADPDEKCEAVARLRAGWLAGALALPPPGAPVEAVPVPGRPERPPLVPPRELEHRGIGTREGHAALIHALAHIEFYAVNLALDAVYRFRDLSRDYYGDWLQVADEEAQHFLLLRDHLRTLGYDYGAFPAHDGLWQMCVKTAHDPLVRMALVPRLLEARGLDANPALAGKLGRIRDTRGAEILAVILRDEIGHVRIGNRWYEHLCGPARARPGGDVPPLLAEYGAPRPRPPLHLDARRAAGFRDEELAYLETGAPPD